MCNLLLNILKTDIQQEGEYILFQLKIKRLPQFNRIKNQCYFCKKIKNKLSRIKISAVLFYFADSNV
jgi:hypothetical protein